MDEQKPESSNAAIRTFVILDLETTGLYNKPRRITEIALVAALREHILGFRSDINELTLPRVLSKMCLCVNPMKMISPGAIEVSGLSNEILECLTPFDDDLFNIVDCFIKRLPQPVCIIAHNGNKFDFPILQNTVQKIGKVFPDHILCADSYIAFQEIFRKDNLRKMMRSGILPHIANEGQETVVTSKAPMNKNEKLSIKEHVIGEDLSRDISQLQNNISPEEKHDNNDEESEESELCVDGYENALCEALEAVESSPIYRDAEKLNGTVDELDASVIAVRTNVHFGTDACSIKPQVLENDNNNISPNYKKTPKSNNELDEARAIQEIIERTPLNSGSKRQSHSNYSSHGKHMETPTKGKRGREAVANKVRKRLNFSPEKEESIAVPKSLKLGDVYRYILQREPIGCHRAENDCLILLECIVALQENFLQWADKNAIQLNAVEPEMKN